MVPESPGLVGPDVRARAGASPWEPESLHRHVSNGKGPFPLSRKFDRLRVALRARVVHGLLKAVEFPQTLSYDGSVSFFCLLLEVIGLPLLFPVLLDLRVDATSAMKLAVMSRVTS